MGGVMGMNDRKLTRAEIADMRDQVIGGARRIRPAGAHRTAFVATSIAVVLVAALAISVLTLTTLFGNIQLAPVATPSPTNAPTPTATPTRTPSPTPTIPPPVIEEPAVPTCENILTDALHTVLQREGLTSWETDKEDIVQWAFGMFPGGIPDGSIFCFVGRGPDVATDNVLVVAWAPLDPEQIVAAEQAVVDAGVSQRVDTPEGTYFTIADPQGPDDPGYLFTESDVRWTPTKDDLAYIKAPGEEG